MEKRAGVRGFLGRHWKKLVPLAVLLAVLVAGLVGLGGRRYLYNSQVGFEATNFSNPVTPQEPIAIHFTAGYDSLSHLAVRFTTLETGAVAGKSVSLSLEEAQTGQVLQRREVALADLGRLQVLPVDAEDAAGKGYIFRIETDTAAREDGVRVNIGTARQSDITEWHWGSQLEALQPELSIIYQRGSMRGLQFAALMAVAAACVLVPPFLKKRWLRLAYQLALLLAVPLVLLFFVERLNMGGLRQMNPWAIAGNTLLYLSLILFVLALCNRFFVAVTVGAGIITAAGIANYYTLLFRQTVVLPADLYGIGTAAGVVARYSFQLTAPVVLAVGALAVIVCAAAREREVIHGLRWRAGLAAVAAGAGLCSALMVVKPQWLEARGVYVQYHTQTSQSKANGFLLNFALNLPDLVQRPPEGYDPAALAEALPAPVEADAGKLPHVIVIMNESLVDFSLFGDTGADRDPLPFLHSMAGREDSFVGKVVAPTFGGATSMTEFETLTQFSLALAYPSNAPFTQFIRTGVPSLATAMGQLGYKTLGTHPADPQSWERGRVYPLLGFEDTAFIDAYADRPRLLDVVTDQSVYDYLIEYYEANRADPLFIFAVTIQNHGGYQGYIDIPEDQHITVAGGEEGFSEASNYLTLAGLSDRAFENLVGYFEAQDEPVMLVMYGDHLPAVETAYFDRLFGVPREEMGAAQLLDYYTTPLIIWNNFGADMSELPGMFSTHYLGSYVKQAAGLSLTAMDAWLLELAGQYPVVSPAGVVDAAGSVAATPGELMPEALTSLYAGLEYNALFDTGNRLDELFSYTP